MVRSSLIACKIDEGYFTKNTLFLFYANLKDSMRTGRLTICIVLGSHSMNTAFLDQIKELFSTADILFVEANNIDVAFIVLANGKNVSVIE